MHEHVEAAIFAWQNNILSFTSVMTNTLLKCFVEQIFFYSETKEYYKLRVNCIYASGYISNPWLLFAQNKLELTVALLILKRKRHTI